MFEDDIASISFRLSNVQNMMKKEDIIVYTIGNISYCATLGQCEAIFTIDIYQHLHENIIIT